MKIALGVGGGIAAYKAAEIARALMERGAAVEVILTAAAEEFVRPLTFAALTSRKVITSLFASSSAEDVLSSSVEHIRVAQENDVLLVAPATADLMAKFAHGLADDFLSTLYLAFTGRVILAPAMNTNMWNHPATQANVATLAARGHVILPPDSGPLACGTVGPGRLPDPVRIAEATIDLANRRRDLEGETILITAGPTQEPIDPVRFISNRSSGKMGYALAAAAAARGARVILISGPVELDPPYGVELVRVVTALEMHEAVMKHLAESTIIVKAAAVADYHIAKPPLQKIKKTMARMSLELDPTPDILAEVGRKKGDRLLIGFAAETSNLVEEGRRKLETKNCDMVVANLINLEGTGFGAEENEVTLVMRTGEVAPLARLSKREVANLIFDHALKLRLALHATQ
ncbi:MAG: bifunctional phosphopantothenoylcysteine decarboxylase/phosphopantothenate--cysteine ligase CoaBC [Bryobacteraceae bacterium]|nr:bifunctional phosphopantothenoylcysteine decarboxylase/phosphopantothenate--cysteine ligase CoaBC [Bryobacteraceae bacterium]MDW8378357.1 bifunctional phosphopantothenoylcysteine decarboxylase/phosphopantothenate--cysteine ligase CoaBC [Bryobacterales bacterium]